MGACDLSISLMLLSALEHRIWRKRKGQKSARRGLVGLVPRSFEAVTRPGACDLAQPRRGDINIESDVVDTSIAPPRANHPSPRVREHSRKKPPLKRCRSRFLIWGDAERLPVLFCAPDYSLTGMHCSCYKGKGTLSTIQSSHAHFNLRRNTLAEHVPHCRGAPYTPSSAPLMVSRTHTKTGSFPSQLSSFWSPKSSHFMNTFPE